MTVATISPTIAHLRDARSALAEARTFSDVQRVLEQAAALREVAKRAERYFRAQQIAGEAITAAHACTIDAAEIEMEAKAKLGDILQRMAKDGERQSGRGDHKAESHRAIPPLAELGITPTQSSRWQQVASIPKKTREQYYKLEKTDPEGAISAKGLMRFAAAESEEAFEETVRSSHSEPWRTYLQKFLEVVKWAGQVTEFDPEYAAQYGDDKFDRLVHMTATAWDKFITSYDQHRNQGLRRVK